MLIILSLSKGCRLWKGEGGREEKEEKAGEWTSIETNIVREAKNIKIDMEEYCSPGGGKERQEKSPLKKCTWNKRVTHRLCSQCF